MFALLQSIWNRLTGNHAARSRPVRDPVLLAPSVPKPVELHPASGPVVRYVLPLRWSLHYALTKSQWRGVRERHKTLYPDWERCSCPKRCKANTLDEKWRYDHDTHTKIFIGADFICPGCHWLKTPPWRIQTWLDQQRSMLPVSSKAPHIIDCLGWTQERVDLLRTKDLKEHQAELIQLARLAQQVRQGTAALLPSPIEQMSPKQISALVKPGQEVIVPWRVDLSMLARYGYSAHEITTFEQRMYKVAASRMSSSSETLASGRV